MDIALLLLLILLNGIFAMSEIAVISSRHARLKKLANESSPGAKSALKLKTEPSAFFSTIQVGITMVGILSGAIGETALADPLTEWLAGFSPIEPYARGVAVTVVVVLLTYFSVVVGELVPKRLGLYAPEKIASIIAPPMKLLARATKPLVWVLSSSSNLLLRLMGAGKKDDPPVTNAEIKLLMEQGAEAGVFHESEQALVANVLYLDEQSIKAIMTPRQDIYLLDLNKPKAEIHSRLVECPYSRIVVCRAGYKRILGLLRTADLVKGVLAGEALDIEHFLHPPLFVWEAATTSQLIENFRRANLQCALIVDEYGELQGLVTLTDVLESIVGELPSSNDPDDMDFIEREDGSWLVNGGVPVEKLKLKLKIHDKFPGEEKNAYVTVAGFVIHLLGRIPIEADHFEEKGYRFEVVDMDRNRVDKVLISRIIYSEKELGHQRQDS